MARQVSRWDGPPPSRSEVEARLREAALSPSAWRSGAGTRYDWHRHGSDKVLYCVAGSVVFHIRDAGDVELRPGDRLDLPAGTDHAATVGEGGVECVEAFA